MAIKRKKVRERNHSFNKMLLIIHVSNTMTSLRNRKMHQTSHVSVTLTARHREGVSVYVKYTEGTKQLFGSKKG